MGDEIELSLCDIPVAAADDDDRNLPNAKDHHRRSSSEPCDLFEFLITHDFTGEMSHAEDIISCGKLVPFNHRRKPSNARGLEGYQPGFQRKRSESFSDPLIDGNPSSRSSRSWMMTTRRNAYPFDYRRLRRNESSTSETSEIHRNASSKSSKSSSDGASASSPKAGVKHRWYALMFGPVRFVPEISVRDARGRKLRRNPAALFPPSNEGLSDGCGRCRKVSSSVWGFLDVLSCKNYESVSVTTSFECMHPV